MGSKYASALYLQKSMKMQLLNILSEFSLNLLVYFFKKIVVLKAAFYSNPIISEIGCNISCKFCIKMCYLYIILNTIYYNIIYLYIC